MLTENTETGLAVKSEEKVRRQLSTDEKIDFLELRIIEHPGIIDLPVDHEFTPGLYIRTIKAPAGTLATTYIHMKEHPFVLSVGEVTVLEEEGKAKRVKAPYRGITKAGTRRVVYVHEYAEWTTYHPTELTDVDEVEQEIFAFRTLPDGTNVRDRFREAIAQRSLEDDKQEELEAAV